jgi:hypothetical protein
MSKNEREDELWRKWHNRERLTNAEMEEALALEVGLHSRPPAEDDPRYPAFLVLWSKCARFATDTLTSQEADEAMAFGIKIPYPLPTVEQTARRERQLPLIQKRVHGEPWAIEEREIAIETEMCTREDVAAFVRHVATLHERGYRPWYRGGLECEGVHIDGFPRTAEGGYEIPCLLTGITYRGKGMEFVDVTAEPGRNYVRWIGRHRRTGKLVAFTSSPYRDIPPSSAPKGWGKIWQQIFGARPSMMPVYRSADGIMAADSPSAFSAFDTPDYECVTVVD